MVINPFRGSTQSDINYEYKEASARATAREHAEKIISNMVVSGVDVTEEEAEFYLPSPAETDFPQIHPHAVPLLPGLFWRAQKTGMGGSYPRN